MPTNQKGYVLTECLIGLIILTTVGVTLAQTLPTLLHLQHQLETEQSIYHKLYELKDQTLFYQMNNHFPLEFNTPVYFKVTQNNHQLCATYTRGDSIEQTLCF